MPGFISPPSAAVSATATAIHSSRSRAEKREFDWVILGASHAMPLDFADFNAQMQHETGLQIINLASPGTGPLYNRFVLEHFCARIAPAICSMSSIPSPSTRAPGTKNASPMQAIARHAVRRRDRAAPGDY